MWSSIGVPVLVEQWVHKQPTSPALRDPATGVTLSYAQLWDQSGWLADELRRHGAVQGDIIGVGLDRSIEFVVCLLGIMRAGLVYLPLDRQAPPERLAAILAESRAKIVVGAAPDGAAPTVIPVPDQPSREAIAASDAAIGGDDPCYVMYTSGSTGMPKGVVVPHRAVVRLVTRAHYCVIAPGDRCANASNPAFDATTFEVWGTLAAGGTVVVFPSILELTIGDWVDLVRAERIDTMFMTTSLFHTVAREQPDAFGSLANLVVGGEQLEMTAVRRVLAAAPPGRLVNGYGPTETTTFAAYYDCTMDSLAGLDRIPIGFPLQDTSLHVLGEELEPLPPGETGELCIGGPGVALGYLERPSLTEQRFVTAPMSDTRLYRTGDLARQLPSGAVELLGRRDRQVKLRGFRIELEEIEKAAMATGLCDAVAVNKIGDGPTAYLAAFVLPAIDATEKDQIISMLSVRLAEQLPRYMIPARWVLLDELPFGPTGKLDHAQLLTLLETDAVVGEGTEADLDEFGEALRQIWQDVLGIPHLAVGDNFLDLGGNSIMAVQVATRIQDQLEITVEPADVLLADSLADLARDLRTAALASA